MIQVFFAAGTYTDKIDFRFIPYHLCFIPEGAVTISMSGVFVNCSITFGGVNGKYYLNGSNYTTSSGSFTFTNGMQFEFCNIWFEVALTANNDLGLEIRSSTVVGTGDSPGVHTLTCSRLYLVDSYFEKWGNTTINGPLTLGRNSFFGCYNGGTFTSGGIIVTMDSFLYIADPVTSVTIDDGKGTNDSSGALISASYGSTVRIQPVIYATLRNSMTSGSAIFQSLRMSQVLMTRVILNTTSSTWAEYPIRAIYGSCIALSYINFTSATNNRIDKRGYIGLGCVLHGGATMFGTPTFSSDDNIVLPGSYALGTYDEYTRAHQFIAPWDVSLEQRISVINVRGHDKDTNAYWSSAQSILGYYIGDTGNRDAMLTYLYGSNAIFLQAGEGAQRAGQDMAWMNEAERIHLFADNSIYFYPNLNSYEGDSFTYEDYRALSVGQTSITVGLDGYNPCSLSIRGNAGVRANDNGDRSQAGTLGVDGAVTLASTLSVGSTSSLKGKVTITTGGLACTGAATFSSTVTTTGAIKPSATNTYTCGASGATWKAVYATNTTIQTSDERFKTDIQDIPEELINIWPNVRLRLFKWKDSDTPRLHAGVIAQEMERLFESYGLNIRDYSFFCYDEWDEEWEEYEVEDKPGSVDEEGIDILPVTHMEKRKIRDAGNSYAIRYDDVLVIEAAYQRHRADKLEEELNKAKEDIRLIKEKLGI